MSLTGKEKKSYLGMPSKSSTGNSSIGDRVSDHESVVEKSVPITTCAAPTLESVRGMTDDWGKLDCVGIRNCSLLNVPYAA